MKKIVRPAVFLAVIALLYGVYALFGAGVIRSFTLRAAEQAREAGDAGRAADLYARALDGAPRDEALRFLVCDLYREAGNFSRAEYTLTAGLRDVGPGAALYKKLCAVYVEQDKLLDAVLLLDGIRSPDARDKLETARPKPPAFLPSGGTYEERFEAELSAGAGCLIYVSWTGAVPSVSGGLYTGPYAPPPGATKARAVAVDPEGLVSGWADCEYLLENVVDPVVFADPAAERVIRRAVGRADGPLYTSDLWDVAELISDEPADYRTLEDLLYCPKLQTLDLLGEYGRCDLSALPSLDGLTSLSLRSFGVDSIDLEQIGQCAGLEALNLAGNNIGSVAPLAGLESLQTLDLAANSILDVTPLGRLGSLRSLRLSQNAVQDLMALSNLSNLRELRVDENRLTSLIGLEGLTRLEVLNASYNAKLTSVAEIAGLASLARFAASHCQIEELPKDLSGLKALEELYLAGNGIPGIGGLAGLPSLRALDVQSNAVGSLEPLSGCAALETLNVSRNMISSAEPLAGLPALASVSVEYNALKTLLPLKECPSLKEINAFGNSLTDPLNAWDGTGVKVNRN